MTIDERLTSTGGTMAEFARNGGCSPAELQILAERVLSCVAEIRRMRITLDELVGNAAEDARLPQSAGAVAQAELDAIVAARSTHSGSPHNKGDI